MEAFGCAAAAGGDGSAAGVGVVLGPGASPTCVSFATVPLLSPDESLE